MARVMTQAASPPSDTERIYACHHCPKRYARKDYLERHELNHTSPGSVCPACGKGFARPDVLRKHLSTSCKSRRGSDGDAPAPLTTAEEDALVPRKRRRPQRRASTTNAGSESLSPASSDEGGPARRPPPPRPTLSYDESTAYDYAPPLSASSTSSTPGTAARFPARRDLDAHARFAPSLRLQQQMPQLSPTRFERPSEPSPDGPARIGASLEVPLAPAYAGTPENLDSLDPLSFQTKEADWHIAATTAAAHATAAKLDIPAYPIMPITSSLESPVVDVAGTHNFHIPPPTDAVPPLVNCTAPWNPTNEAGNTMEDIMSWLFQMPPDAEQPASEPELLISETVAAVPSTEENSHNPDHDTTHDHSLSPTPQNNKTSSRKRARDVSDSNPGFEPLHHTRKRKLLATASFPPLPDSWDESGWRFPPPRDVLDEQARDGILSLFEGPARDDLKSPAFSLGQMKLYFELYYMHFAPLYPVIHRPSLGYRRLPSDLLLTMLCIGTAFAENKDGFHIATRLHKRLRNRVFEQVEEEPCAPPHSLLTLLLINHFSRSYCSLKEHDVGQIFHSPSMVMCRLAGVFISSFQQHRVHSNPLDHWLEWVQFEERKRLGWMAFLMDTESAALFRHYLIVHCFTVKIDWPCDDAVWAAEEPFAWSALLKKDVSPPPFRHALRQIAGRGKIAPSMSETHLWILVHGMISVSWTLLWRDLGDLSMVHEGKVTYWKDSLRRAFYAFRDHAERVFARRVAEGDNPTDVHVYWTGVPLAHLGCILLLSDTELIRIYCGASNIAGRPISPGEWHNASACVNAWARSPDGAYAVAAAVELLSSVFQWSHEARFVTAPTVIPWCIYVASLVIFAYSSVTDGRRDLMEPYIMPLNGVEVKIESSFARRDALAYLARLRRVQPQDLPGLADKNKCTGVLAYTAYLVGLLGRGIMDESRRVLLRILRGEDGNQRRVR